jgi:hypothetical protein
MKHRHVGPPVQIVFVPITEFYCTITDFVPSNHSVSGRAPLVVEGNVRGLAPGNLAYATSANTSPATGPDADLPVPGPAWGHLAVRQNRKGSRRGPSISEHE